MSEKKPAVPKPAPKPAPKPRPQGEPFRREKGVTIPPTRPKK